VEVNVRRSKKETAAAKDKRPPVSVSDLVLHPDELNHSISFSFNLRKLNEKIDLVSGYLIIVLKSRQINPPRLVVFPSSIKIINGAPSNFRRGQQFAIRYGKMVKGVIKRIKNPKSFNTATIFAYSFQGELLLKKTIVVSDVDKTS